MICTKKCAPRGPRDFQRKATKIRLWLLQIVIFPFIKFVSWIPVGCEFINLTSKNLNEESRRAKGNINKHRDIVIDLTLNEQYPHLVKKYSDLNMRSPNENTIIPKSESVIVQHMRLIQL